MTPGGRRFWNRCDRSLKSLQSSVGGRGWQNTNFLDLHEKNEDNRYRKKSFYLILEHIACTLSLFEAGLRFRLLASAEPEAVNMEINSYANAAESVDPSDGLTFGL